jgi:hypothetical protein
VTVTCGQKFRLEQELATAPRTEAPSVLIRHAKYLQSLPGHEREDLLTALEDVLREKV